MMTAFVLEVVLCLLAEIVYCAVVIAYTLGTRS